MSTVATRVGTFVWHEQVSSDPAKAEEFYTQLFGWGTEVFKPGEIDYKMISSGGQTHGGFSTAMEGAPPPHWRRHSRTPSDPRPPTGSCSGRGCRPFGRTSISAPTPVS